MTKDIDIPRIDLSLDSLRINLAFGDNIVDGGNCIQEDLYRVHDIFTNADLRCFPGAGLLGNRDSPG